MRRILNLDETCVSLDGSQGRSGGRPGHVLVVKGLKRSGTSTNKGGGTATVVAGSNAASEPLPLGLVLPTDAQDAENIELPGAVIHGLPKVEAQFGHDSVRTFGPIVMSNEKGGMNSKMFRDYCIALMEMLFPDTSDTVGKRVALKVDSGPGRLDPKLSAEL